MCGANANMYEELRLVLQLYFQFTVHLKLQQYKMELNLIPPVDTACSASLCFMLCRTAYSFKFNTALVGKQSLRNTSRPITKATGCGILLCFSICLIRILCISQKRAGFEHAFRITKHH